MKVVKYCNDISLSELQKETLTVKNYIDGKSDLLPWIKPTTYRNGPRDPCPAIIFQGFSNS